MSNSLISAFLLVASMGGILTTLLIRAKIIAGINNKLDGRSQISIFDRDLLRMFRLHRQFHPDSPLRSLLILSLALSMVLGLSFTLALNLSS
jgi:hypothetical protein